MMTSPLSEYTSGRSSTYPIRRLADLSKKILNNLDRPRVWGPPAQDGPPRSYTINLKTRLHKCRGLRGRERSGAPLLEQPKLVGIYLFFAVSYA